MKIALIHDHLTCKAGGEQVALTFHKAFPHAPIYTLSYNPNDTFPEFKNCDIRTSWFQHITSNENRLKKLFFPLGVMAMRSLYLDEYDIVLISGTHCGKYVRFSKKTIVIGYCFTPFRLAWNPASYAEFSNTKGIKKLLLQGVVSALKKIDYKYAQRVDFFLAMTAETKERIEQSYSPRNEIEIINPPVNNLDKFNVNQEPKNYYLLVSRLEYYKKVDLAILAFNKLKGQLVIVGRGSKEQELKDLADPNQVVFKKDLSTKELTELYSNCKAFIFPQHEDYGLTALEANAAGRPVIAFGKGGVLDTQIPITSKSSYKNCTAVFFKNQTVEDLTLAVNQFEKLNEEEAFDPNFIRKHAETFSEQRFIEKIRYTVNSKIKVS